MSHSKRCSKCKQEKPLTEFYIHYGRYHSWCKSCIMAGNRGAHKLSRFTSRVQSETLAIAELARQGIPAMPGKTFGHQWADLVLFGCLLVEVKSSHLNKNGQFHFGFSPAQRKGRLRGDVIVLMCLHNEHASYHVFPSNHPVFYNPDGKLKAAVGWTPQRKQKGIPRNAMTDELMLQAKDNWTLVHQYVGRITDQLRFGATLPLLLNAA